MSPTLPSQPGGRPTGKLRLTWPFSTAGPACHTLLKHRRTPSMAPQRRGHSVAPKGWRKGSRSSGNPDPHWQNGTKPRKRSVETEMKLCPASQGTGRWAVAVTPPAVSAQLQPRRPSLQQHPPRSRTSCPFLLGDTCGRVHGLFSVQISESRAACISSVAGLHSVPGCGLKGHQRDGLSTGLWSAGLPPWIIPELPSDLCTPGPV